MLVTFVALLMTAAPVQPAAAPAQGGMVFTDEEPPPAWHTGSSSSRLALPVVIRFDEKFVEKLPVTESNSGGVDAYSNAAPAALRRYAPALARRHFEEARWTVEVGKGREIVIRNIGVTYSSGPYYQVQVVVDRVQDGHRLGQATGRGSASANHQADRIKASWGGAYGAQAANDAYRPKPEEDAFVIGQAAVQALDNALYQLASVWSSEQQRDAILKAAQHRK